MLNSHSEQLILDGFFFCLFVRFVFEGFEYNLQDSPEKKKKELVQMYERMRLGC